jgi:hypothetical protein
MTWPKVKFTTGIFMLLAVLGIFYLVQINSLATKGYEMEKLQRVLTDINETNRRLELEVTALKSIENLEDSVRTLNLVPSQEMRYFQDPDYAYNPQ